MKVRNIILFSVPVLKVPQVRQFLTGLDLAFKESAAIVVPRVDFEVKTYDDDPRTETVCNCLGEWGVLSSVRREGVYSEEELRSADMLAFILRRAPKGFGGPHYGTKYDLSHACEYCGTGARQTSPLYLEKTDTPKSGDVFQTLDYEYLVSPEVAKRLTKQGLTGFGLLQAKPARDGSDLDWFQILPEHQMPMMAEETKGIVREKPCPFCDRDGYFHTTKVPLQIVYEGIDSTRLPDAVVTYERFGRSGLREPFSKSHIAAPMLLVKPGVRQVFRELRIRGAVFGPVRFK